MLVPPPSFGLQILVPNALHVPCQTPFEYQNVSVIINKLIQN